MSQHQEISLPALLTIEEAARALRLSSSYVRELTASGQLPCIQFGKRKGRRVSRSDLLSFIERHRNGRTNSKPRAGAR